MAKNNAVNLDITPGGSATITFPSTTGTLATLAGTETLTNKTLTSAVLNTGVSGTAIGIADNLLVAIDSATVADNDYGKFTANGIEGRSYAEVRSDINVEDGADVTDTANVTSAGALMDSEVDADIKTLVLPASTTISTFGASLIDDVDASTARTTLGLVIGTDVLAEQTIGIANDNLVEIDDADAADNDYCKLTVNGIEGRSYAEVVDDIGTSIDTVGTIGTGTWEGTDIGVAHGGTGVSTLTDHGVLVGSGASAITALTVGTTGQILVGATGADPIFTTVGIGVANFRVYRATSNQTLTNNSWNQIEFNAEEYDDGADYDPSSGYDFTAPENGTYHFSTAVELEIVSDGGRAIISIYVGGAEKARLADITWGAAATGNVGGSATLKLSASDSVEVWIYLASDGNKDVNDSQVTSWFSGFRVV